MPFDPVGRHDRRPKITVLPPTPEEPPRGPGPRIHIEIEIIDRRPRGSRPRGAATLLWWCVIGGIAMMSLALVGG